MNEDVVISGITLRFETEYESFPSFMKESADPIYKGILSVCQNLEKVDKVALIVQANIDGTEFDSTLEYTKDNISILKDVINPFYEGIEEYETCEKIMKLYSTLTNN